MAATWTGRVPAGRCIGGPVPGRRRYDRCAGPVMSDRRTDDRGCESVTLEGRTPNGVVSSLTSRARPSETRPRLAEGRAEGPAGDRTDRTVLRADGHTARCRLAGA
jgi:hypothetical protein